MLEASAVATAIPSLWSIVHSWFTPAVLFLLLNLMIATIALTSSLTPTNRPSHDMHAYPQEQQQEQEEGEDGPSAAAAAAPKQSPSISILNRVKSLGLFSPRKSPQKEPPPLIPPEEFNGEMGSVLMDPFEKQRLEQPGSPSPVGKFEAFDFYSHLPQESASEIPPELNPPHYIFEPTHPQEVLLPVGQGEKVEEEGGEEDREAAEEEEEEEEGGEENREAVEKKEETREGDGHEEEREVPNLLLRRGIRRSESLNVKFSFLNVREEEGRGGRSLDEGVVVESVEKRRPATVREGKGKLGGGGPGGDEEVDARADDFINRFKQQLKLQRMDSQARQKDAMIISKVRSF